MLRGLARDDLFTVVHEQVLTDTARYADVVLPATTHFEADDLAAFLRRLRLQRMRPVIDRSARAAPNDELAAALAARLGPTPRRVRPDPRRDRWSASWSTTARSTARPCVRQPGEHGPVRRHVPDASPTGGPGSSTPTASCRVPRYRPLDEPLPADPHQPGHRQDDQLDARRVRTAGRPCCRSIRTTRRRRVWSTATRSGSANDRASIVVPCPLDPAMRPGVVRMPKGLWRRQPAGGLTANTLVPATINDLAGGACFNDARVEVGPACGSETAR